MNILQALFNTSIGKKIVMAVTGLILFGFVVGHLVGNLQIFSPPEKINAYAHFLQNLGPALWVIRGFLLVTVLLHVWMAVALVMENKAARGPKDYANQQTLKASYASRTMRYSGLIVLAFIVYHIMHFTTKNTHGEAFYPTTMLHGEVVADVHTMMVLGFQQPLVAAFYLIAIALLSWHLSHGLASMFQSLGLRTRAWSSCLNKFAVVFSVLYFLGNAAIVGAAFTGAVKIQNEEVKVAMGEICSVNCEVCETVQAKH
ncbi:succinate dehydrogenase cytochrome b subunit [Pelagicoccus sp. SDUM812003]|uniref:succinate dehydrogenase cytochrome b subunit n=1 Tax=Pelagicoccus sp. SDUM812003 TaxID=3041267 RepID=UPI00280E68FA|nr:succinate dehydrogenase cytochrome b subunit [Pelagicoccus sp. SDUM812003]MDQ8205295.1 succinate dehydrogenase cytochrome b subunit [Pelagicoccus sp. SDUM812003]